VFVGLDIQHKKRILHTVICDLSSSTIFSHITSSVELFLKHKNVTTNKICIDFLLKYLTEAFLILRRSERYMIKNVKYRLFFSDFNEN
jgi:hypothetical protein